MPSLADDFSIASNSNSDTWSYRLKDFAFNDETQFNTLLPNNSRSANDVWGTALGSPPLMWSDPAGYWGIGRNDSGVTQNSGALSWAPGEVLLHPKGAIDTGRLVISWLAPSAMTIDANWTFSMASGLVPDPGPDGEGVGIQVESFVGGVFTTHIGFANPSTAAGPINGSLLGLTVAAGDRLYWSVDNWVNSVGDITKAEITITEVIPEPSSFLMLGLCSVALLRLTRRKN